MAHIRHLASKKCCYCKNSVKAVRVIYPCLCFFSGILSQHVFHDLLILSCSIKKVFRWWVAEKKLQAKPSNLPNIRGNRHFDLKHWDSKYIRNSSANSMNQTSDVTRWISWWRHRKPCQHHKFKWQRNNGYNMPRWTLLKERYLGNLLYHKLSFIHL